MNPADTNDWRELSRIDQVLIYTICWLHEGKQNGFIEGGHVAPTPKSQAAFREMRAAGWKPTTQETDAAIAGINEHYDRTVATKTPEPILQ
jgi:hypothetical protein